MPNWYRIKNQADAPSAEVFLYDEIGGWGITASAFVADFQKIPKDKPVILRIHSPGGSVFDGQAIITTLKNHPAGVTTCIDGLAASMAAIIALAGKPVKMASNALMMIHNVSGGGRGSAEELRKTAELIEKVQETTIVAIIEKTNLPREEVVAMLDAETWLSAEEALAKGFVDEITGAQPITASHDLSKFKPLPFDSDFKSMTPEELKAINDAIKALQDGMTALTARVDAIEATLNAVAEDAPAEPDPKEDPKTPEARINAKFRAIAKSAAEVKTAVTTATAKLAEVQNVSELAPRIAQELAASFGVKPGNKDRTQEADKPVSRADFSKFTPKQKADFFKGGGKLTD